MHAPPPRPPHSRQHLMVFRYLSARLLSTPTQATITNSTPLAWPRSVTKLMPTTYSVSRLTRWLFPVVGRRLCICTPDAAETSIGMHNYRASSPSTRSEEHTSELQSRGHLVCRLLHVKIKD